MPETPNVLGALSILVFSKTLPVMSLLHYTYSNIGPRKKSISASPRETLAVSGPQNVLFPSSPVNKC